MLAVPSWAAAQVDDPSTRVWLGAGLAAGGSTAIGGGFGLLVQIAGQRESRQLTLRAILLSSEVSSFPDGGGEDLAEVGLLYGRTRVQSYGHASISVGLSLVGDGSRHDSRYSPGMPFAAEVGLEALVAGVGAQVFGSLNPYASFVGLAVFLELGWLGIP